jgi:tripartite-type tricarboxylate transporter receptor subunit TctC
VQSDRSLARRRLLQALAAACALPLAAHAADAYPARPIKMIVPAAAGGNLDITARVIGQKMSDALGQPVVINNIPNMLQATRTAAAAPPDGYTLLGISNTFAIAPSVNIRPGYDPVKDFTGIGPMNRVPLLIVTAASKPDSTLKEFIEHARRNPGVLSYASGGVATTTHLAAAMLFQLGAVKLLHVPYKGNAPAIPDVVSGREDVIFDPVNTSVPMVRDGKFKALATTGAQRTPLLPNVPTAAEQGFPGYEYSIYTGLVAPAGTPKEAIAKLQAALGQALGSPELRERFARDGTELSTPETPEQYTEFLRQEVARNAKLVSEAGIPKQ